jgi:hypothetical protein
VQTRIFPLNTSKSENRNGDNFEESEFIHKTLFLFHKRNSLYREEEQAYMHSAGTAGSRTEFFNELDNSFL